MKCFNGLKLYPGEFQLYVLNDLMLMIEKQKYLYKQLDTTRNYD